MTRLRYAGSTPSALDRSQAREQRYLQLLPPAGDKSISSAITMPTSGINVHWAPNQCTTAVYHSSVLGRNTKPSTGHSGVTNTPLKLENSHNSTITTRGMHSAIKTSRHDMADFSDRKRPPDRNRLCCRLDGPSPV